MVKPGENYASLIIRLTFEYQKGAGSCRHSVLVKIPSLSQNYEVLKSTNMYSQEIFTYQQLLPELYKLWKGEPFAPLCYTISSQILVLEDLSLQGFRKCDKMEQLDLDHCLAALTTLAKYHATTLKYLPQCGETVLSQLREPINGQVPLLQTLYLSLIHI